MDGILTGSTDLMLTFLLLSLQYEISFKLAVGDQSFLSVFYFFQERDMRFLYFIAEKSAVSAVTKIFYTDT